MALMKELSLEAVRDSLVRQEDSMVFAIIERAKFPINSKAYEPSEQCGGLSLVEFFVREAEALQAKSGRYQNPEENPFFPENLPSPLVPPYNHPQVFHPSSASVCVNKDIWDMYFNKFLPLFTSEGDDGKYAETVGADLVCLQALSRRIHYGKHVAEVKFSEAPQEYSPLICAQDNHALMKLLTFTNVEEMVKKRVAKKAKVFGQNVTLEDEVSNGDEVKCKVDPCVVSRLYADWVMPLTKIVEVEYLLRRLD
nr:Chorismate mutase 3 [Crinum x powellii]